MAILLRAVTLTLLMALPVVGCQPEGRTFQTTLPTRDRDPLPVSLTDETGLVTGIAQADVDPATIGNAVTVVHTPGSGPNELDLTWIGGLCDQDATVRFHVVSGGNLVLNVAVHQKLGTGCPAAGVPRAVRIATSSPITVDSITVAGG